MSQADSEGILQLQRERFTPEVPYLLVLFFGFVFLFILLKTAYLSILMIPTFFLIIFMRTRIKSFESAKDIKIRREFSTLREVEGGEIEVSLLITNSKNETQLLDVIDSIPDPFELVEGTNTFVLNLHKNESIKLQYKVKAKEIGIFEFGKISIRQTEFFGFLINTFTLSFEDSKQIMIAPKVERFEKLPIYSYWIRFFNGFFVSKQFGQDSDFKGIKEYQYGDKLQYINWKASSRFQNTQNHNLFSNRFSFDSVIEFEIVYDLTFETYSIHIESMRIVATLVEYLLRTKNKVGITIIKEYPDQIKAKVGARQFKIIIDELLRTKPDEVLNSPIMLDRMLNISNSFKNKSIVILISPLTNKTTHVYAQKMKQHGFNVIAIQPDAYNKQLTIIPSDQQLSDISTKNPLLYNVINFDLISERQMTIDKMFDSGILLLPWDLQPPIEKIFYKKKIVN